MATIRRTIHFSICVLALAAVVAASSLSGPATAQTPPPSLYLKTFDNYIVDHPTPFGSDATLDVLVHTRDRATWAGLEPMAIEHGSHCEAPPATHQSPNPMPYEDAVFLCAANPHLMTSLKASAYGLIYLTPAALADFSGGETVIRFDVSTLRASGRDWIDVWVTPFDDLMAAPLQSWLPDLQGEPRRGIHARMDSFNSKTVFRVERLDGHAPADLGSCWWCMYEDTLTPSASRRDTFELRISKTHVKFWMPQYGITWVDADIADLGWDRGVVQLGHHSYTPEKDCFVPVGTDGCRPGTWHWDNVSISPSASLSIIPARERRANATQDTYTFPQPASDGAYLQVNAMSTSLEMSLDGGATWQPVAQQPNVKNTPEHMRTFWQTVPAGTSAVKLRGPGSWAGPWDANHAAIYSQQPRGNPTPPTVLPPTNTPIPTETPAPTFTPGPTSTPEPIVTVTPTNTSAPMPTATNTPLPATSTSVPPTATQPAATATPGPQGNCSVTVAPNRKTGSWSCP